MRRARRLGAAALVISGLLLAGCGITTQSEPSRIDRDEVPFGLLRNPPTSAPDSTATTLAP